MVVTGLNEFWKPEKVGASPEVFTAKRRIGMRV